MPGQDGQQALVKNGSNYVRVYPSRLFLEGIPNTEPIKITNKEPTETTVINKKAAPNNIFSDNETDGEIIHQSKNPEIDVLFKLMV